MPERKCHIHADVVTDACPKCVEWWAGLPDVATMTPEQRCEELRAMPDILEVDFDIMWKRIDELVGRGTYTHEVILTDQLCAEILGEGQIDPVDSVAALMDGKPVFVIAVDDTGETHA